MRTFKYNKPGTKTYYGLSTLAKRYAKQYEALGRDEMKFDRWLREVKGFKCYYL